jgi:hypothetical protein
MMDGNQGICLPTEHVGMERAGAGCTDCTVSYSTEEMKSDSERRCWLRREDRGCSPENATEATGEQLLLGWRRFEWMISAEKNLTGKKTRRRQQTATSAYCQYS